MRSHCLLHTLAGLSAVLLASTYTNSPLEAQAAHPTSSPVTAFVNVAVVPMDSERVLTGQTVVVRDGNIVALGPGNQVTVPAGAISVDGTGKYLIPGLADMHTHVAFEDSLGQERMLLSYLAHGVTTIRDMDFQAVIPSLVNGRMLQLRKRAAAGDILSPRIYTSGPWFGSVVGQAKDAAKAIPAYKAAGYDFVKIHEEDKETFDSVSAAAHRVGLPVVGHVPKDVSIGEALEKYKSIEHLTGYYKHVYDVIEKKYGDSAIASLDLASLQIPEIAELAAATKRAGVWNCPTVIAIDSLENRFGKIGMSVTGVDTKLNPQQVVALHRRIIKGLQDAGAGLLVGTDEPNIAAAILQLKGAVDLGELQDSDTLYTEPAATVHGELAALVKAGLTPYQALVAGTRNVAAYFEMLKESGTVTVGKRADLVLLNGNPLLNIDYTAHPAGVMLGGQWLSQEELNKRLAANTHSGLLDLK